ncbi:Ribulose bisphosphate carboxylase-like protein [Pseudobythopirellula maris]|uniref:Ribulose bisphosphate carboxylase-like protein n=1 Tax=Pseudobythopirellula maris TaxID=2527991 RepID=A0A5C5ZUG7_9BACT|nr:ribulose-bisphosphate carboxylase large subunit family protein [Pseudobythopirellula maris]TWT91049.1 Ribulose bisphosphate carboxylase-like protein [Pseudobythopirellula maris]
MASEQQGERLRASYWVETPLKAEDAAAILAGEQSTGTFVAVPGETEDLKIRHAARVERVEELETVAEPSLPGSRPAGGPYRRARVEVSWPIENFGYNLPAILSTVQGNLFEIAQFSGLRLLDIDFPASFAERFPGPRRGVAGTRELTGAHKGPLIGTIIKPSVGLKPEATAAMVGQLAEAGIDFVKDDELMANPPHAPFNERVDAVMRVINDHADRTGKRVMFAFNVTDEHDAMLRHYDKVVESGGTCAMVSLHSVGLTGAKRLAEQGDLAVHGHRNGWGMLTRHPVIGADYVPYIKLWRLAGVDQLHVNGVANKFWEPDDSVVRSIEACHAPLLGQQNAALPVVSSGQWGGQAFETYRRTGTLDLLYQAGGGVMAHPGGPAAGVRALRQAWDAAAAGLSLAEAAEANQEFRQSVERFGDAETKKQVFGEPSS